MAMTHPVQLRFDPPATMTRVHVLIRLVLLAALGTIGCSSLYAVLYLALPAVAALEINRAGGAAYLQSATARATRTVTWLASAYGYLWMLTDAPPASEGPVQLTVDPSGSPTVRSALLRLITSLPALLILAVLSIAATLLWCIGALIILVRQQPSAALMDFFALTLRYRFRLVAYHASLVDRYPTTEESPVDRPLPTAQHA
jgi:hypothetical protein